MTPNLDAFTSAKTVSEQAEALSSMPDMPQAPLHQRVTELEARCLELEKFLSGHIIEAINGVERTLAEVRRHTGT